MAAPGAPTHPPAAPAPPRRPPRARRWTLLAILTAVLIACGLLVDRRRELFRHWNVRELLAAGLDGRLIPHRVNRLATLDAVLARGIRSMEMDVLFRDDGAGGGWFEVGHDEGDASGVRLDAFLERMAPFGVGKLWLDAKNLAPRNLGPALRELQRLDARHGVRRIAIVEFYDPSPELAAIAAAGFDAVGNIADEPVAARLAAGDHAALARIARQVAARTGRQAVRGISFRLTIWPFVKEHLEPLLPPQTRYHAWDSVELRHWGALDELRSRPWFADPRLATIVYRL